ncbi:MAG: tetratricopeptide repeat protein [Planctomycetota bacterium]|nr:tetratricopeptide repeat protein [Planctomycetota bacterium]
MSTTPSLSQRFGLTRTLRMLLIPTAVLVCLDSATLAQGFGHHWMHHSPVAHLPVIVGYQSPIMGAYGYGNGNLPWSNVVSVSTPWSNMTYGTYSYGFASPYAMGHFHNAHHLPHWQPAVSFPSPVIVYSPPILPVINNPVIAEALRENQRRWNDPLDLQPVQVRFRRPKPSTLQAQAKSLRYQRQGDARFRNGDYVLAYSEYRKAVAAAEDQSRPQVRLALSLTAVGRFSMAVRHFKRAVEIDPSLPSTGESLSSVYGVGDPLAKSVDLRKAADWVREDIRDPDRLFLLGVLLHFDDSTDKAAALFEAALRLAGHGEHLKAFLRPQPVAAARNGGAGNAAVAPQVGRAPQVPPLPIP